MKNQSLLSLLVVSFTLFASACGGSATSAPAGGTLPGAPAPAAPNVPATGAPGEHQNPGATCNSNPGCDVSRTGGSCVISAQTCIDYNGGSGEGLASFKRACETSTNGEGHGTYNPASCSTSDLAGSCKTMGGTPGETVIRFYASAGMTSGIVQGACTNHNNCAVYCAP